MKERIGKIIRTISLFWGYFTSLTLVGFGLTFLKPKKLIPFAIIVFSFALAYAILNTLVFVIGPKKKRESKKKKRKRDFTKFIYQLVKLCILILPLLTLNPNWTVDLQYPTLTTALSIAWLVITIGIEIAVFILKRIAKKISEEFKSDK